HTVKNTVITDKRTKKIKALGKTVPGKIHDKKLADEEDWPFPPGSQLWEDTAYQGYEPEQTTTHRPKKKPRGGELTAAEKEHNRAISKERIGIEHSIGGAKAYRIVRETLRQRKADFADLFMVIACGLHNLRLDFPVPMRA
ncbi:MAG: transposase family protein, partial [Anaerolineae bacterium]|nr:transposase family protein [Anaerolineae bacterium]